jgi:hypothetical protein
MTTEGPSIHEGKPPPFNPWGMDADGSVSLEFKPGDGCTRTGWNARGRKRSALPIPNLVNFRDMV